MALDNDDDNGILAHIGGGYFARTGYTLPPASAEQDKHASVELEVPGLGPVRITYELMSHRHESGRNWFWTATFAELAPN